MVNISVIIPTKSRSALLLRAVESVLNQSVIVNEIIIVDDNSEDDTEAVCKKLSENNDNIIYTRNNISIGGGGSRNLGVKLASGDWVAFLDDDDIWLPDKIKIQLLFSGNYEVIGCKTCSLNNDSIPSNQFISRVKPKSYFEPRIKDVPIEIIVEGRSRLNPTGVIIKKTHFDGIGGFDEDLESQQGRDLFIRLSAAGSRIGFVDQVLTAHYQVSSRNRITGSISNFTGGMKELTKNKHLMTSAQIKLRMFQLYLRRSGYSDYGHSIVYFLISIRYMTVAYFRYQLLMLIKKLLR